MANETVLGLGFTTADFNMLKTRTGFHGLEPGKQTSVASNIFLVSTLRVDTPSPTLRVVSDKARR